MDYRKNLCKWSNPTGKSCYRYAKHEETFCKWHLMENRIALINYEGDFKKSQVNEWIISFTIVFLIIICSKLFHSALNHFTWFGSQAFFGKEVGHNPSFGFLFLGLALLLFTQIVLMFRNTPPFFEESWFSYTIVLIILWAVGIAIKILPSVVDLISENYISTWVDLFFLLPIGLIIHGIERRKGLISLVIFLFGLGCIFGAGLLQISAELIFRLTGMFNLAPNVGIDIHFAQTEIIIFRGICYCGVAIDILIAIYHNGNLITPFPVDKGYYRRLFRSKDGILRIFFYFIFVCMVLYGQAQILRHLSLIIFGKYIFDIFPILYLLIVIFLHFYISKKSYSKRNDNSNL